MTCDLRFSGISRSRSFSKFSRLSAFGVVSFCLGSLKWQNGISPSALPCRRCGRSFQDGQVMAHRLHCQFLLFQAEILIVTDELLVELSEGEVRDLEFRFDEFGKGAPV